MSEQPQPRRRRSHELEAAIRAGVLEELSERGYQGLTYEGVARRVGTSKPVLYRRFSTRADMAIDAFLSSRIGTPPADFHGPLREDLIALIEGVLGRVGPEGVQVFRGVIGEVEDATVARVATMVTAQFDGWLDDILDRARSAGETGGQPVSATVRRAIVGLVRNEVLFTLGAGQAGDVPALVDEVMVPLIREASRAK